MSNKKKTTTRLSVESLESRWVPAGNVLAYESFDPGTDRLTIVGDHADNQIRIVHDATNHARIEGLNGTTVNGETSVEIWTDYAFVNVDIQLGHGADSVDYQFTGGQANYTPVFINTGNDQDVVHVEVQGFAGWLFIDTGLGDDQVTLDLAAGSILRSLNVNTGSGDDSFLMNASTVGDDIPLIYGGLVSKIETDQGNDVVQFTGRFSYSADSRLLVNLGAGDDTLIGDPNYRLPWNDVECVGGSGFDTVRNADYFNGINFLYAFELIED